MVNMNDLISRSALIESIQDRQKYFWDSEEINDEYCNLITLANEQPTVEAKPVVHGEWIEMSSDDINVWYMCDACKHNAMLQYDFCPNCGADMRGGKND